MFGGILGQFFGGFRSPADVIREGASQSMTNEQFIYAELTKWISSVNRAEMLKGLRYYQYEFDRDDIPFTRGSDGEPIKKFNCDKDYVIDNLYANMVDQKVNYILGKPFSIQVKNEKYAELLNYTFDKAFRRMLSRAATSCVMEGISWIYPYYNEQGEMVFKAFPGHEIMPFWLDEEHTKLDMAIRYYTTQHYDGKNETTVEHVEVFSKSGIQRYVMSNGTMVEDVEAPSTAYAYVKGEDGSLSPLGWERVPLVALKYNAHEIPLIKRVETLQEAINKTRSNWTNSMNEDINTTILAVYGYDGENIAELRQKIISYGAVLLSNDGKVDTLRIERDSDEYTEYLDKLHKALIENARGFDCKDDRMSNNPNMMNLRSMYADIDLDADMMETQFQAAFDDLLWFVDRYLISAGQGDYRGEEVKFTFNRNIIVNDSETIQNVRNSEGIVSNETLLAHHPYVESVQDELKRLKKEESERAAAFSPDYLGSDEK